jgi:hypothetical protein
VAAGLSAPAGYSPDPLAMGAKRPTALQLERFEIEAAGHASIGVRSARLTAGDLLSRLHPRDCVDSA